MFVVYILVGFTAFAVILAVGIFNQLISLRNQFRNAFSQIDVQLKRRYDLVPNLVETAKAYLKHERETLEAVTAARQSAVDLQARVGEKVLDPRRMKEMVAAESALSGALSKLMAVAENYPELKADKTMNQLSEELTSTENRVAFARQAYNDAAMSYNIARESFPNVVVANFLHFKEATSFEIETPEERSVPRLKFG